MTEETIAHVEAVVQEHGSDAWWTFEARFHSVCIVLAASACSRVEQIISLSACLGRDSAHCSTAQR